MTPAKHRVAAGILFLLALLIVIGTIRTGLAVDWDPSATVTFGRRATPFSLVVAIFAVMGVGLIAAAIWQLGKARR